MYEYKNYMDALVFKEQQLLMKVNLITIKINLKRYMVLLPYACQILYTLKRYLI